MPTKTKVQQPTDTEIGRHYVKDHTKDTLFSRGYWYRYGSGVWQQITDATVEVEIWKLLEDYEQTGLRPTLSKHRSILAYCRSHLAMSEDMLDSFPHLINLKNGIYNLETGRLTNHSPLLFLTSQLPFEYDEKATCPWWVHYVKTTFVTAGNKMADESLSRLVQEALAYSITIDVSYQVMFWCLGEGENGKGVLFHVLSQLGGDSATPLDLNSLGRERYQLATLADKRIALCSESSSHKNLLEDATIKALVAGDEMQVRQIRREPFVLKPQVKLWWSMNRLPVVADTSHGMWRRIIMLPFNQIFDDKSRIRNLKERLDKELPGIFNWCLDGYKRLIAQAHFSYCGQSENLKGNFQFESNTVRLFVDDCCTIDENAQAPSKDLFDMYTKWTKANGYKPMSNRNFKSEMESLKYFYSRGATTRFYTGLKIDDAKCRDLGLISNIWQSAIP